MLLTFGITLASNTKTVHADVPNSMQDIATQFAKAGAKYSNPQKGETKYVSTPGQAWTYMGPGGDSILATGSKGTKIATYQALKSSGGENNAFGSAGRFAYALRQTGLDHPSAGGMNIIIIIGRWIVGFITMIIMYVIFILQAAISVLYNMLKWINPFTAFGALTDGGQSLAKTSIWNGLIQFVSPVYNFVRSLSVTGAIIGIASTILFSLLGYSITNDEKGHHLTGHGMKSFGLAAFGGKLLKYFVRIMLIFGAPLLIAMLANDLVNMIGNEGLNVTNTIATHEIYGNFVNFDKWVEHSQLALPSVKNNSGSTYIKGGNVLNQSGSHPFTEDYLIAINADGAGMSAAKHAQSQSTDVGTAELDAKPTVSSIKDTAKDVNDTAGFLMGSFANGSTITATDWESEIFAEYRKAANKIVKDGKKAPDGTDYGHSGKKQHWYDNVINYVHHKADTNKGINIIGNIVTLGSVGKLKADTTKGPWALATSSNYDNLDDIHKNDLAKGGSLDYTQKSGYTSKDPTNGGSGLSVVGMYNYLNCYADGTGIQYTQPKNFLGFGTVNQHASAGFIGHGLLSLGSLVRMWVMMSTAAFMVFFVFMIMSQGIVSQIPRMLLYGMQLATGRWKAVRGVINAMVGLYARILIGVFLVYFFENSVYSVNDWLDAKMTGTLQSALIMAHPMHQGAGMMPLAISMNALGFARLVEALITILLMYAIFRSYHDILKWLNKAIDNALSFMASAAMKHHDPDLAKNLAGQIGQGGSANPSFRDKNNRANNNRNGMNPNGMSPNGDYMDNDGPDTAASMEAKLNDDNATLGDDQPKSLKDRLKQQTGMLGLDTMDKFDNSKAGQAIKKGAAALGGAIGASKLASSKLAEKLGMQSRGDGRQAFERTENRLRQGMAMLTDPQKANNSKRALLSKADKQRLDAAEQDKKDKASVNALRGAHKKFAQAEAKQAAQKRLAKELAKNIDKNGKLKDPKKVAKLAKELEKNGAAGKKLKQANKAFKQMALNHDNKQQKRMNRAMDKANKAKQNYNKLKKLAESNATTPEAIKAKKQAQQALPKAHKQMLQAQQKANKMKLAADPISSAAFTTATGKLIGSQGQNLHKATKEERQEAQDRQFTALTGKTLKQSVDRQDVQATPEQMKEAKQAIKQAQATLNDPQSSLRERYQAKKDLDEANVVARTGYQYGKFADQNINSKYTEASQADQQEALAHKDEDKLTAQTGFKVSDKAPEASTVAKEYSKEIAQAQNTLQTGQVTDSRGNSRLATADEMTAAKRTLASSPEARQEMIQNQMMTTASAIEAGADKYVEKNAQIPEHASAQEASAIKQTLRTQFYQSAPVQNTLKQAGIISDTAQTTPAQTMNAVQHMANLNNIQKAGISASLAPLRQQIQQSGAIADNPREIIRREAKSNYGNLPAANNLVDSDHYGKTTNTQVKSVAHTLLQAYGSGSTSQIQQAKQFADKYGIANNIKNDPNALRKVIKTCQSEEDSVVNRAMSQASALNGPSALANESIHTGGTPGTLDKTDAEDLQIQKDFDEFRKQARGAKHATGTASAQI